MQGSRRDIKPIDATAGAVPFSAWADGVRISLWVQPRASRTRVVGLHEGALKIQVAAPPVEGEANEALVAFLAKTLGVKKSQVRICSGEKGRRKVAEVSGVTPGTAANLLLPA